MCYHIICWLWFECYPGWYDVIISCICCGDVGQILLQESISEVELTKNLVSEKQDCILSLEQVLAKCQSDLAELEKKLNDALHAEVSILWMILDCTKFDLFHLFSVSSH